MGGLPTILVFVAGICWYVGMLHLLVGWQRAQRGVHVTFAMLCFCIAGAALATSALYQAQTVASYTRALKWQQTFAFAAVVPLLWFVAFTTGVWLRTFLWGMSGIAVFALAVNLAAPFGIFFTQIGGLTSSTIWWGEQIAQPTATVASQWHLFLQVSFPALLLYSLHACAVQYRRGDRRAALRLGLGLSITLLARGYDRVYLLQGTPGPTLMVYGYLALILVMSLGFLHDLIEVSLIRQRASAAIHMLNTDLEQRVSSRTAELQATNEQLEQQRQLAERRRQVAESLGDLLDLLNADRPLGEVWEAVTATTSRLFGVQSAAVFQQARGGYTLLALAGCDSDVQVAQPSIHDLFRQAMAAGQPLALDELVALAPEHQPPCGDAAATEREPVRRAALVVPLIGTSFSGLLLLTDVHPRRFSGEDVALASALSDQVVLVIDNANLQRQVTAAAVVEERTRLARELHDSVTQSLYAASLLAEALPQVWSRNTAEGMRNLTKMRQLMRGALAEMRTLLFELRPAALVAAELGLLLKQLGDVLTGHTRIPVELTVEGQTPIPADVKIAVYRIAQETFNNIAKHACATRVSVTLRAQPDGLYLVVRDDGCGFDPDAVPAAGMGLRIMAERAADIGAWLYIDSTPRRGTVVTVKWPAEAVEIYADHGLQIALP